MDVLCFSFIDGVLPIIPYTTARATARVARTIPTCPFSTSPGIVRATLAVALSPWQSNHFPGSQIVFLAIIHKSYYQKNSYLTKGSKLCILSLVRLVTDYLLVRI